MTQATTNGTPCAACMRDVRSMGLLCLSCDLKRQDRSKTLPQELYVKLEAHEANQHAHARARALHATALPLRMRVKLAFFRAWRTLRGIEP